MNLASGIMVFIIVWWIVIFAVLPWGVKTDCKPQQGHDHGAPSSQKLGVKFLITTLITIILWLIIDYAIRMRVVTFQ